MSGAGFVGPLNTGSASGSAGSATANADFGQTVSGFIFAVYVRYNDSPPATTDVTIKTKGNSAPSYDILTLTDANTDGLFFPRTEADDTSGSAQTAVDQLIPIHDDWNAAIAGADSGDSADVWLYVVQ